jgi:hypothetical protein
MPLAASFVAPKLEVIQHLLAPLMEVKTVLYVTVLFTGATPSVVT